MMIKTVRVEWPSKRRKINSVLTVFSRGMEKWSPLAGVTVILGLSKREYIVIGKRVCYICR